MKKLLVSFAAMLFAGVMMAQPAPQAQTQAVLPDKVVKFKEVVHDFGKIKQNVPVNFDFAFKNISKQPVVIETATASCGCTTPKWPQQPIAKNKSDKINAGFNAATLGIFEKTITVKIANVPQPLMLKIKGEVLNEADYAKYTAEQSKKSGK